MYTETANNLTTLIAIDRFWDNETPAEDLLRAFNSTNWQIQQAALLAVGDRAEIEAVPKIVELLEKQDQLAIYGANDNWAIDHAPDIETREIWRCRFRVKQAACIALGAIGEKYGVEKLGNQALTKLEAYAVSQDDDCQIRAAACHALGQCQSQHSIPILEQAAQDGEWCTKTEAEKALFAKKNCR